MLLLVMLPPSRQEKKRDIGTGRERRSEEQGEATERVRGKRQGKGKARKGQREKEREAGGQQRQRRGREQRESRQGSSTAFGHTRPSLART